MDYGTGWVRGQLAITRSREGGRSLTNQDLPEDPGTMTAGRYSKRWFGALSSSAGKVKAGRHQAVGLPSLRGFAASRETQVFRERVPVTSRRLLRVAGLDCLPR